MNYLPSKLVKLRKHYNYSQSYLAQVLGVDVLKYMGYENGNEMINYEQIKKLSSLYHVSLIDIFKNSDDIPLYEIDRMNTDEINIEYFNKKKSFFDKFSNKTIVYSVIIGVLLGLLMIVSISYFNLKKPYEVQTNKRDKLAVSQSSVVYIDSLGAVKGSGDNSNGQLSNLPSSNAIKVVEGEGFTVILNSDGTLSQSGLSMKYADEIAKWNGIIDIAAGDNHVVGADINGKMYCTGSNNYKQCDISNFGNIKKVYATPNGTIGISNNESVYYTGEFIGKSLLKQNNKIIKVAANMNNLIVLKEDGTCEYSASYDKAAYIEISKWKNICDIACGNDFFAALKEDGQVLIAIDNYEIEEEVSSWKNIEAIAAGEDFIIAFDGENIMGAGNNAYNKFNLQESSKVTLPKVSGIKVHNDSKYVYVSFDPVKNASAYKVSIDVGIGITYKAKENEVVKFDTEELKDGYLYEISVVALGEGDFQDSNVSIKEFIYTKEVDESNEKITIKNGLLGVPLDSLKNYFDDLQISYEIEVDEDNPCLDSVCNIIDIEGITPGETYRRSVLDRINVKVKTCKLSDVSESENEKQQQSMAS